MDTQELKYRFPNIYTISCNCPNSKICGTASILTDYNKYVTMSPTYTSIDSVVVAINMSHTHIFV